MGAERLMSDKEAYTMAVQRECPECGAVWVSAVSQEPWKCEKCDAVIPIPEIEEAAK
jgi:ribosomal protein L37AE/L43A